MICPHCDVLMTIEHVRVHKTTCPERDDTFENMWWCEKCQWSEEIETEEKDEYDPDAEL